MKSYGMRGIGVWIIFFLGIACGQVPSQEAHKYGAEILLEQKLGWIKGKRLALVTNLTSRVYDQVHLVDTLHKVGQDIKFIYAPEHGFRGEAEAGAHITGGIDSATGIPIRSLYGEKKKPSLAELQAVDVVLFDIQDVGVRFYTYLSTLVYVMEACAEANKPLIVLDRPNPNGWYIHGPVLSSGLESFVGLHPVPVVYGMTLGEYAKMVNGERWLKGKKTCRLEVLLAQGYRHDMHWSDWNRNWVPPSPNLPTVVSAEWYPVLGWYEGTPVSVGRGTPDPFTRIGAPWHQTWYRNWRTDSATSPSIYTVGGMKFRADRFIPSSIPGKSLHPPYEGQTCFGVKCISSPASGDTLWSTGLQLLISFYQEYSERGDPKVPFFNSFFSRLSGDPLLIEDIMLGKTPNQIIDRWKPSIGEFRRIRSKYLLYP
jgi:uncharacterized protein YbbC (DUF1343 family)